MMSITHQVSLVQNDAVCIGNLLQSLIVNALRLTLVQLPLNVLGIRQCDDSIQVHVLQDLLDACDGVDDAVGVGQARGLDDDLIKLITAVDLWQHKHQSKPVDGHHKQECAGSKTLPPKPFVLT